MDYQIIRSRRKSIALFVEQGKVKVKAPYQVNEKYIAELLLEKSQWLEGKITQQLAHQQHQNKFSEQGQVWFHGKLHSLKVQYDTRTGVVINNQAVVITLSKSAENLQEDKLAARIKRTLEHYFKQEAEQYIKQKLPMLCQQMQLSLPRSVKVRQYRARWGSCNSRKELSFNYLLMMVPAWVFDYVIVHELCHLTHLNHSQLFWQQVAHYDAHYLQAKDWLKQHQHFLHWQH